MTYSKKKRAFLAALLAAGGLASPLAGQAPAGSPGEDASLGAFLDTFGSGDQPAYQRYIERSFDPEALRATSAEERADRLARLYVDSGGFVDLRRIRTAAGQETAIAAGRHTRLPYCLTLKSREVAGRRLITDFAAVDLPLPASPGLPAPAPSEVARTMTIFMDRLARADTFSGVFLIAREGRPIVRKAYGKASLANCAPVTLETRFNIASIGKSITAVMIGQLLDEGRLGLDDKVGRFLPDYPDEAVREKVTIRHLLTHTSGLGEESEFTASPLWTAARFRIRTLDGYLPLIVGQALQSEPGTRYSYSNAGFVILGLIMEKVTGRSFYDLAAEKVFRPAGMTRSFYHEADAEDPGVATPLTNFVEVRDDYGFRLGPRRDATLQLAVKGGSQGGAFVTADDLLRFMTAVRTAKLTSARTAQLLTTPQGAGRIADMKNGFGFEIISQNGHTIVGHAGGDIGVSAFIYHFNETGYTVVVLSNYDPRAIRVIARQVRGLLTRSTIGNPPPPPSTDCSTEG